MVLKFISGGVLIPLFLLLGCVLLSCTLNGQKINSDRINNEELKDILYSKNHFSFSLIPNVAQKAIIKKNTDRYIVHATPQLSLKSGFNYHINFNHYYALIVGLHGGVVGRNVLYLVPKEDFNPQPKKDITSTGKLSRMFDASYISIPILFQKRWLKEKRKSWNASIGFNVRYAFEVYASEGSTLIEGGTLQTLL